MADAKLKIIISAQDKASGTLGSVGKALSGLGGLAKGALIAGVGLAAGAVAGLGAALVTSTAAAMESENVQAQLNAVLKSTNGIAGVSAKMVNNYADSLSKMTKFDDEAIVSAESLLLTFTNISADVFPVTTEAVLNVSQAMGQDLKTSALQLGKALNDPTAGMAALRRVGIQFTDSQEAQVKALQKSGDLLGAQKVILAELERQFGGAARAAGQTFSGQLAILGTQVGNVKESIGLALIPALTGLATALGPTLIGAAEKFGEWLGKATPKIDDYATRIGNVFKAVDTFGLQSSQAEQTLDRLFGEGMGQKIQDVAGWIGTAKDNTIALKDAFTSEGWNSTAMATALQTTFGTETGKAIQDFGIALGNVHGWMLKITAWAGIDTTKLIGWAEPVNENMGLLGTFKGAFEGLGKALSVALPDPFGALLASINAAADALRVLLGLQAQARAGFGGGGFSGAGAGAGGGAGGGGSAFQAGTPWAPGGWATVGERGPELVRLPRGSRVYPADRSAQMTGGGAWNVTINLSGAGDPQRTARAVESAVQRAVLALGGSGV